MSRENSLFASNFWQFKANDFRDFRHTTLTILLYFYGQLKF